LGIGESILMKAIVEATGKSMNVLKAELRKLGDLGLVAQASTSTVRTLKQPKPLTIAGVFDALLSIAKEKGNAVRV
jgi:DNA ligase-1